MSCFAENAGLSAESTLCISLADRPSRFGVTVHNAAFRALELDFLYKAFRPVDLGNAVAGVRGLGIRGCGVSMPYKVEVVDLLDDLHAEARALGAVNTIVNDAGILTGYNTDARAARRIFEEHGLFADDQVLVLGAGGVARAIVHALGSSHVARVMVAARDLEAGGELASLRPLESVAWDRRETVEANVLINATPLGMRPELATMPVDREFVSRMRFVYDVVADPRETALVAGARDAGCSVVVDGFTMALYQAAEQFQLYTGRTAPLDVMREAAEALA